MSFPTKQTQGFLKKWLIPDQGQGMYRNNLVDLVMSEIKPPMRMTKVMSKGFKNHFEETKDGVI